MADSTTKLMAKSANRGNLGIYIGRAVDHSTDTHRIYSLKTHRVVLNRYVKFLNITYYVHFKQQQSDNNRYIALLDDEEYEDYENYEKHDEMNVLDDDHPTELHLQPISEDVESPDSDDIDADEDPEIKPKRLSREMRRLDGFFNPQATSMYCNLRTRTKDNEHFQPILLEEPVTIIPPTTEEINNECGK
jgi:hypothetical protein